MNIMTTFSFEYGSVYILYAAKSLQHHESYSFSIIFWRHQGRTKSYKIKYRFTSKYKPRTQNGVWLPMNINVADKKLCSEILYDYKYQTSDLKETLILYLSLDYRTI